MSAFTPYLKIATSGQPLSADEMSGAMDLLLSGSASDIEIAGFLSALRARGETVEEITAAARSLRHNALRVEAPDDVVDTCTQAWLRLRKGWFLGHTDDPDEEDSQEPQRITLYG